MNRLDLSDDDLLVLQKCINDGTEPPIELAKKLGLKRLVIMPDFFASGKALIDFVKCGISIEVGPHEREENINEVLELIKNFAENKTLNENIEIFEIFDVINKEEPEITINNFEDIKKGDIIAIGNTNQIADFDFIPVLVNEEAYEGILCLACRKVSL